MTPHPFGATLQLKLTPLRSWLALGPGWAAAAGFVATGLLHLELIHWLRLAGLWLLVDPLLGTCWQLARRPGFWPTVSRAELPSPEPAGWGLPYAQADSLAGRLARLLGRYQGWWQGHYWPAHGSELVTFGLAAVLALLIGLLLQPTIFWLTLLALSLILLAGQLESDLSRPAGGRLQSLVQWLLPWLMGSLLSGRPAGLVLLLGFCYWIVYLGGLRMAGRHDRAELLFFGGQLAVVWLLLAWRALPGAVLVAVLLAGQLLIRATFPQPGLRLAKAQPYLLLAVLIAAGASGGGW